MKNTISDILSLTWGKRWFHKSMIPVIIIFLLTLSSCSTITATPPQKNLNQTDQNEQLPINNTDNVIPQDTEEILDVQTINDELKIHFIDVGQADSILIQDPSGKNMLIDAGNNEDSSLVVKYLDNLHIRKIDVLIGTHPHEDHIGGLDAVIDHFSIGKIYMPKISHTSNTFKDVLLAIKNKGYKISTPLSGSEFKLGNSTLSVLSPISSSYSDLNDYSITLRLRYRNNSFIFMGDAEELVENEILEKGYNINADVIKIGHHGSNYSSSSRFIKEVDPKYAIITVGENSYGHPHVETLSLLKDNGIKVYRTDEVGTIVISSDGKNITIDKNASSLKINAPPTSTTNADRPTASIQKIEPLTSSDTIEDIVYITSSGTKYHKDGCSYLNKSKIAITLDNAESKGLSSCSKCY